MTATEMMMMLLAGAVALPLPQPKDGTCPSGYRESGGYCVPTSERRSRSRSAVSVRRTGRSRAAIAFGANTLRRPGPRSQRGKFRVDDIYPRSSFSRRRIFAI
jgi:hypothetical protein